MPRLRLALALILPIGGLVAVRQVASEEGSAAASGREAAASFPVDDELEPRRLPPPTTTTTAAPPTTTTAPPPPPTTAAPRVRAASVTPAPKPAPAPAPAPPPPTPASTAAPDSEARALRLVNDERARNGLPALRLNGGATSVARSWSSYMASHSLGHNPNLGRDLQRAGVTGWRTIKENVGYGQSADQIHAMFMGSGGHRDNILSSEVSEIGIGVVNKGGTLWLTMDFVGW